MTETVGSHLITRVFGTSCIRGALRLISVMYILNLKPYRGAHFAEWLSLVSCVVSDVSHAIRFCYNRVIRRVCFLERIKYCNGRKQQRASTNASRENQWNEICGALFVSYSADYLQFVFKKKERKKIDVYIWRIILSDMREVFLTISRN